MLLKAAASLNFVLLSVIRSRLESFGRVKRECATSRRNKIRWPTLKNVHDWLRESNSHS